MKQITIRITYIHLLFLIIIVSIVCSDTQIKRPVSGTITFGAPSKQNSRNDSGIHAFRNVFIETARNVTPCVVAVMPTKIDTIIFYRNPFYRFFEGDTNSQGSPFDFFFGPAPDHGNEPPVEKRTRKVKALGSGVIVAKEGYIITNFHVISGATEIEVRLSDNRTLKAAIVGSDSLSDVAVIKIKEKVENLPVANLGNSDSLQAGEWVAAIGNPFNLLSTITAGIISALNREIAPDLSTYQNFIQTDAAINPGNSGGALVNTWGEVIGINTLIYSESGGFMGIGFAIPINMAKKVMEDLIYEGKVIRGWIGLTVMSLKTSDYEVLGLKGDTGVIIAEIFKNQPAEKAGLRRGDIIVSINNTPVTDPNTLRNVVASIAPGKEVPVVIYRNKEKNVRKISVTERTSDAVKQSYQPVDKTEFSKEAVKTILGINVTDINKENGNGANTRHTKKGVAVLSVDKTVADTRLILKHGDIITKATILRGGNYTINNVNDFLEFSKKVSSGKTILLTISSTSSEFTVPFKVD
jgi:serine protease Do